MIAGLFNKNEFKGIWHNSTNDKDWIARTCQALAFNPSETEVYYYAISLTPSMSYIFDENKNMLIQGEVTRYRTSTDPETGEETEVPYKSWETVQTIDAVKFFPALT